MSFTLTVTGTSSELESTFFPPILLPGDNWYVALLNFETFYTIHNVPTSYISIGPSTHTIPKGSYELFELEKEINISISPHKFDIKPNNKTHRLSIQCSTDFSIAENLASILGFETTSFKGGVYHSSTRPAKLLPLSIIQIDANIARGAYINGKEGHTIHAFFPNVPSGFHINESPSNLIYVPVTSGVLDKLVVRIVDEQNSPIDFNGETVTVRLHLKQMQ